VKLVLLLLIIFGAGCMPPDPDHRYTHGDCVIIKLSGERAMVTQMYRHLPQYTVRVASGEYAQLVFQEFELERCPRDLLATH